MHTLFTLDRSPRAIIMRLTGFFTIPVVGCLMILGAYLLDHPAGTIGQDTANFANVYEEDEDGYIEGSVEFYPPHQHQSVSPYIGSKIPIHDKKWLVGNKVLTTQEVISRAKEVVDTYTDLMPAPRMTCFNANGFGKVQGEVFLSNHMFLNNDFDALPEDLKANLQQTSPNPPIPETQDFKACGSLAGRFNDLLEKE